MMFNMNIRLERFFLRESHIFIVYTIVFSSKLRFLFDRFIHGWAALVHIHGRRWRPLPSLP